MFHDILCDHVDGDVLFVPLTAFDVFFYRPLAAVFSRLICPAIVPETRTAHRQWRKWPREMAGRCSEFNGKKPETLQKPDLGNGFQTLTFQFDRIENSNH